MDFQKYINNNQNTLVSQTSNPKKSQQKPKVIKFVGDMQENIKQLLQNINCNCGNKKQFHNILLVFANKIEKLRKQREHYKMTLKEYLLAMNNNSLKNQHAQKSKKHDSTRKSKTLFKKESQQSTKCHPVNKDNQTPLKKVTNLFFKQKSKTVCLNDIKVNENVQNKQNHETRNHQTAVKKVFDQDLLKQFKTVDKRMSEFYTTKKLQQPHEQQLIENNNNDDGSFSFNLSSFEELDTKHQQSTQQITKQVSIVMNETNLLDSDDENPPLFRTPNKKQLPTQQPSKKTKNLKLVDEQSTAFEDILLSLNTEQQFNPQMVKKSSRNHKTQSNKKKQNPQQTVVISKKSTKKADKINDKQNIKAESCLKKFNITLQKLQEFIQNKECLKQLQKTQNIDLNLRNFKSLSTSLFNSKDPLSDYDSVRKTLRPLKPLEERKFNFN